MTTTTKKHIGTGSLCVIGNIRLEVSAEVEYGTEGYNTIEVFLNAVDSVSGSITETLATWEFQVHYESEVLTQNQRNYLYIEIRAYIEKNKTELENACFMWNIDKYELFYKD